MHCSVSGCGDVLCKTEEDAITQARQYISYFPNNYLEKTPLVTPQEPKQFDKTLEEIIPENQKCSFQYERCLLIELLMKVLSMK